MDLSLFQTSRPEMRLELCNLLGLPSNPIQDSILLCDKRFIMFRGSRRMGKSFTCSKYSFLDFMLPNTRGWCVAPTYELAYKSFRYLSEFYDIARRKLKLPKLLVKHENWRGGDLLLRSEWGSEIVGKSANDPTGLMGEELDWVIVDEATKLSADTWYRYLYPCLTRVGNRRGRAMFACTPFASGRWLYQLEREVLTSDKKADWELVVCPAWETTHIPTEEIETARRELPPDIFMEQYGGQWRFGEGCVYPELRMELHFIPAFPIPKTWPAALGLDPTGGASPFASSFLTKDPNSLAYYIFGEYYRAGLPSVTHFQNVASELVKHQIVRSPHIIVDIHGAGGQVMRDLRGVFQYVLPSGSNIQHRRDLMLTMQHPVEYQPYHVDKPGLYPRIFVFHSCLNTKEEFLNATYANNGAIATADHLIDSAEYALEWFESTKKIFSRPRPVVGCDPSGYHLVYGEPATCPSI